VRGGDQRPEYCQNGNQKTGEGQTATNQHFCSTTLALVQHTPRWRQVRP
jgi:hypothetical protein